MGPQYWGYAGYCGTDIPKVSINEILFSGLFVKKKRIIYLNFGESPLTPDSHELFEVMDMLDRRLNDKGKNWRHVMKALTVLDFIIHNGSENVVLWCKDNLYVIKTLREFQYIDEEGRDQGANIRTKAKDLSSLLMNDERLREERVGSGRNRKRATSVRESPRRSRTNSLGSRRVRNTPPNPGEDELQRALDESRLTMEDDERRRKALEGSDDDLRKAIMLSREEDQLRDKQQQNNNLFDNNQPNLIDTSDYNAFQPQAQQVQPQYTQAYGQVDLFGNPVYQQQPLATGMLQNAYNTGGVLPQYNGYQPQQQFVYSQQTGFDPYQEQMAAPVAPAAEPEPLQPLKTGSNNPFAKLNQPSAPPSQPQQPSLNQIQQNNLQQQQPSQDQRLKLQRTNTINNIEASHMDSLNTMLANGDGIDTFGNVGELRIPAQHTKSTFVNSAGMGLQPQATNNPFVGAQYTGVATTSRIQPAFTGYGFGNAQQSQQAYHNAQQKTNPNNLIDF